MSGATGRFLRTSADHHQPLRTYDAIDGLPGGRNVSVIDLAFRSEAELTLAWDAINDVPDRLSSSDVVIFIWPRVLLGATGGADYTEPTLFLDDAFARREALGSPSTVAMLAHQIGDEPTIEVRGDPVDDLAALARAIQVRALLRDGGAVITPANHHFQLPSGSHARSFVRAANMLRSPRDIWSMAAWLAPRIKPGVGIVLDTATLSPIATQLDCFAEVAGVEIGPVAVLDRYPRSRLEVSLAVENAAALGGAMALLSVNSSGATQSHFEEALQTYAVDRWSVDAIVSCRDSARAIPRSSRPNVTVWSEVDSTLAKDPGRCDHCAHPVLAHVVRIDERSFVPLAERCLPFTCPRPIRAPTARSGNSRTQRRRSNLKRRRTASRLHAQSAFLSASRSMSLGSILKAA